MSDFKRVRNQIKVRFLFLIFVNCFVLKNYYFHTVESILVTEIFSIASWGDTLDTVEKSFFPFFCYVTPRLHDVFIVHLWIWFDWDFKSQKSVKMFFIIKSHNFVWFAWNSFLILQKRCKNVFFRHSSKVIFGQFRAKCLKSPF